MRVGAPPRPVPEKLIPCLGFCYTQCHNLLGLHGSSIPTPPVCYASRCEWRHGENHPAEPGLAVCIDTTVSLKRVETSELQYGDRLMVLRST
jgi:hypothetical protein